MTGISLFGTVSVPKNTVEHCFELHIHLSNVEVVPNYLFIDAFLLPTQFPARRCGRENVATLARPQFNHPHGDVCSVNLLLHHINPTP